MRCTASELEIETIFTRIRTDDIDLQPDFQRGEVWSIPKKRKLIDSILRGWRIPPIHVIENENYVDEVLDGQQRLATIRDFMNDKIKIDGSLAPIDESISKLDGLVYSKLDSDTQRKFKKYSVTIIRLTQYIPEEPAELFYRLNQPATLTSAEQRNAFVGNTRNQIRELVDAFEDAGANKDTIGFSNSRMAYDDVISKFCYVVEIGTIRKKVTSTDISDKYRNNHPFDDKVFGKVKKILIYFIEGAQLSKDTLGGRKLSLNKATLFSWLIFLNRYMEKLSTGEVAKLLFEFEHARQLAKGKNEHTLFSDIDNNVYLSNKYPFYQSMFLIFNQRASMGSTDATSIVYRDIILEIFVVLYFRDKHFNDDLYTTLLEDYDKKQNLSLTIEFISNFFNWGDNIKW
ncbi:DUF262 domain-containing protein [Amphibacillus cookii]|uniref:DUF262 domain-containing protein n=1 Tax=Amphibacillus cookii TaxID=767787 RepID=UPI001959B16F|nr:DUF262 domain-containing protein [Amphibacillus cookii]MBM7541295.1 hypothetical protein [Amphibacillus cookii]